MHSDKKNHSCRCFHSYATSHRHRLLPTCTSHLHNINHFNNLHYNNNPSSTRRLPVRQAYNLNKVNRTLKEFQLGSVSLALGHNLLELRLQHNLRCRTTLPCRTRGVTSQFTTSTSTTGCRQTFSMPTTAVDHDDIGISCRVQQHKCQSEMGICNAAVRTTG